MTKRLLVQRTPWGRDLEFQYGEWTGVNGRVFSVATDLKMQELQGDESLGRPLFTLALEEAQELVDQLWTCGLRPSEGSGSAGSLAATERHLEDMRRLVFDPDAKRAS